MSTSDATGRQVALKDASVQAIHLELIRRVQFNAFVGERIAASLERHADLWLAAWMTRFGTPHPDHPGWFTMSSLVALRDLPRNIWNVDTVLLLTDDIEKARRLQDIADEEDWQADVVDVQETEEMAATLGTYPCPYHVVCAWWD